MDILFFPNGNTAVFENEEPVPELQENWLKMFAEFLENKGIDPALVSITLPNSNKTKFLKTCNGWSILP